MIKKWVAYSACALLAVYLVCFFIFRTDRDERVCNGVEIIILDDDMHVITPDYIKDHLVQCGIDPISSPLDRTLCVDVEKSIKELSVVDWCRCYKTHHGVIRIEVAYKRPLMHIINNKGEEFYIDKDGSVIDDNLGDVYLPLATGFIDKNSTSEDLRMIANFLNKDEFWKKQIAQIYVDENKEIILIPLVGEHIIEIGDADELYAKLTKLREFYKKGLNEIGWNKHSKLNVEFENQVICTIKDN